MKIKLQFQNSARIRRYGKWYIDVMPFRSQCFFYLLPENIRKPSGFLMFSGSRKSARWERMGQYLPSHYSNT